MKRLFLVLFVLLFSVAANAVDYTSSGNGDWNAAGTWGGGGVPGDGDTATIRAVDTVTITDDVDVGEEPVGITTYDVEISGTLQVSDTPGQDILINFQSSVVIKNGGVFQIGTTSDALDCDYIVVVTMDTDGNAKYILRVEDGGELIANGCVGYPSNGANTHNRARIASCSPDCLTGADRVLTLDTAVAWAAVDNPATRTGTDNAFAIIGSGGGSVDPGADKSEIAEITAYPAANQITVTLANDHQVGDIVANPTRNILFESNNVGTHGRIYSNGGEYFLKWVMINEMGDSTAAASIDFDDTAKNIGTLSYVAALNCEDGGDVDCFELAGTEWDTLEYLTAFSFDGGIGIDIPNPDTEETLNGVTVMKGSAGSRGIDPGNSAYPISFDAPWINGVATGITGSPRAITDGLFHWCLDYHINGETAYSFYSRFVPVIEGNEFYHTDTNDSIDWPVFTGFFKDNVFFNVDDYCIYFSAAGSIDIYMEGNTYDLCNSAGTPEHGAIYIEANAGNFYMQAEDFGSGTKNKIANIVWKPAESTTAAHCGAFKFNCNECIMTEPTSEAQTTPIHIAGYTNWSDRAFMGPQTYASFQNLGGVAGTHWGFGPGGMTFERETTIVVDDTLNLKITPYAADTFRYFKIGTVHVTDGDVLTVNVQLRKDEAQAVARTPRLALKGCGFDVLSNYDAMTDVTDTWEEQTVSGTANATGIVHIYIGVLGELDGGNYLEPVDPPTLDVYADAISYSKS